MQKSDAARIIAGLTSAETKQSSAPTSVHVMSGEVVGNSESGKVQIRVDGDVVSPDDEQVIEIDALGGLEEGDTATILLTGQPGRAMTPMAMGSSGSVDRIVERISGIEADYIKATLLEAEVAKIGFLKTNELEAKVGTFGYLKANSATITDLQADTAKIHNLSADDISSATGYIQDLKSGNITAQTIVADHGTITNLDSNYAHIRNGVIDNAKIGHADVNGLNANYAHINNGVIDNAKIGYADVNDLSANYAQINMANVSNAWIENGLIRDAAIKSQMVESISASQLTAGEIDADEITVRNLKASSLTVQTADGYVYVGEKKIPTKEFIDSLRDQLQNEIDGAIETFTVNAIPTLSNTPAKDWVVSGDTEATKKLRMKHVGDIAYVVNSASAQNGYCYRFAYDTTNQEFKWVLIKDSDVTAALSRLTNAEGKISGLETFESDTTSWINETDEGLETIRTNHTNLSDVVDKTVTETKQLWFTKADTTAPNKPTAAVTSTSTAGNAWRVVVPAWNASYPNYFYCLQYKLADGTYAWSDVVRDIAMGESQQQGRKGVADAASAQNTANANIKSSVQLWFTKANTTAPTKPSGSNPITVNDASKTNQWNLAIPTYNSSYPYYFYCYQQQKGDNTYQWTDVVYDRSISEAQAKAQAALPSSTFTTFQSVTFKKLVDEVDEQSSTITQLSNSVSSVGNILTGNVANPSNWIVSAPSGASYTKTTYGTAGVKVAFNSVSGFEWLYSQPISVTSGNKYMVFFDYTVGKEYTITSGKSGYGLVAYSGSNAPSGSYDDGNARFLGKAEFPTTASDDRVRKGSFTFTATSDSIILGLNGGHIADNQTGLSFTIDNLVVGETLSTTSTTVNSVKQLTNKNNAYITNLTTTLGLDENGNQSSTAKYKYNKLDQTLDETISRVGTTESKLETISNPNLTPWFSVSVDDTDYWEGLHCRNGSVTNSEGLHGLWDGEDGWAHITMDSRTSAGNDGTRNCYMNMHVAHPKIADKVSEGGTYTWLVEVRNFTWISATSDDRLYVCPSIGHATLDVFSAANKRFTVDSAQYGVVTAKSDFSALTRDTRGYCYIPTGCYADFYLRISLYEGEYDGPYKPYVEQSLIERTRTAESSIKQNKEAIELRVKTSDYEKATSVRLRMIRGTWTDALWNTYSTVGYSGNFANANYQTSTRVNTGFDGTTLKVGDLVVIEGISSDTSTPHSLTAKVNSVPASSGSDISLTTVSATDSSALQTRIANAETAIEQNAEAITLRATKSVVSQSVRNLLSGTAPPTVANESYSTHVSEIAGGTTIYKWTDSMTSLAKVSGAIRMEFSGTNQGIVVPLIAENCITTGERVTFSITYRGNVSAWFATWFLNNPTPNSNNSNSINTIGDGEWHETSVSFDATLKSGATYAMLLFYGGGTASGNWIEVKDGSMFLERGDTRYASQAELKVAADGITSTVEKISSYKYCETGYRYSLADIKTYSAEGRSGSWSVNQDYNLRVGDTVYLKVYDVTRECDVYIKGTITSKSSDTRINMTTHGYEDVLPVDTIKSTINQSSDSVKIQANHVNIEGAAIFSSGGRLSSEALASVRLTMTRNNWTDSGWVVYETIGHSDNWSNYHLAKGGTTSSTGFDSNLLRVGDLIVIEGVSTDTGNAHRVTVKVTTAPSAASSKIPATTVNAVSSKSAIDGIQVGGRNLFADSELLPASTWTYDSGATRANGIATLATTGASRIYQMPAKGHWAWKANTKYVVSIDAKSSVAGGKLYFNMVGAGGSKTKSVDITTSWARYSWAFTSDATVSTGSASFYNVDNAPGTVQVRLPKLEEGNKATGWSPAPEDIMAAAASSKANLIAYNPDPENLLSKIYTGQAASSYPLWAHSGSENTGSRGIPYVTNHDTTTAISRYIMFCPFTTSEFAPGDVIRFEGRIANWDTAVTNAQLKIWSYRTNTGDNVWAYSSGYITLPQNAWTDVQAEITIPSSADLHEGLYYLVGIDVNENRRLALTANSVAYKVNKYEQATRSTANANVKRTQRIYYRKSTVGAPSTPNPNAWVTNGNVESSWTKYNAWSTRVPPIADSTSSTTKYLYLYTCEQYETAGSTAPQYTTVLLDDSTTVIDGGKIITGSIAANKLTVYDATIQKIRADAIDTKSISIGDLSGSIGGRNLLRRTATGFSMSINTTGFITHHFYSTGTSDAAYDGPMLSDLGLASGDKVTLSFDWETSQNGSTDIRYGNFRIEYYGLKSNGTNGYIAAFSSIITMSASNASGHFTLTSTLGAATVKAQRLVLRVDDSALVFSVSNVKLEKGERETDWTPAPEDATDYVDNSVNGIQVGGRNLWGRGSECTSLSGMTNSGFTITTEDGYVCAHATAELQKTKYIRSNLNFYPKPNELVTASCYVKVKNIVQGTTNPMCEFYMNGYTVDSVWRTPAYRACYIDGEMTKLASSYRFHMTIPNNEWHHVAYVFEWPAIDLSSHNLQPYVYLRDCTGDLYVRNLKYERGNKATDWSPAPEDVSQMVRINMASRSFTTAQWKTYGAVGHSENWTTGTSYDNSKIQVGDTAYLTGTVSDGVKGTATIIGTVTAVNGVGGSTSITMSSTQLIFGGDSVDAAAKTATNYIVASGSGIKIANSNPSTATTYQLQTATGTEFVVGGISVAEYGADIRIGPSDSQHIGIASDGIYFYKEDGTSDANIKIVSYASQLTMPFISMQSLSGRYAYLSDYLKVGFYGKNIKGIWANTKTVNVSNNNIFQLLTANEMKSMTGLASPSYSNLSVMVSNGDQSAYNGLMTASIDSSGVVRVLLSQTVTQTIRCNYIIIEF